MASGTSDIEAFVRQALIHGSSRQEIETVLVQAGWPVEQVRSALAAFAEIAFPVPIPRPRPYLSAREAFLYLILFTTLYLSAYHLGSLLFDIINHTFPDAASALQDYRPLSHDTMRWSIASIVIAFPIFLLISRYLDREQKQNPVKRLSTIRRWLTYLTLFIAAVTLICDLTTLVYNVLGGELTVRFALKVIVVAAIAGTIFGYYLWDLRREEREP